MVGNHHYEILGVSSDASLGEIRAAYHRAAKSNHPDLFPEEERERHLIRMMQINEAYMAVVCERSDSSDDSRHAAGPPDFRRLEPTPWSREVGQLKDPAYTYYKLGFLYFSEGRRTLSKHYLSGGQRIDFSTESIHVLRLAVASLHYFHKAYDCFERVSSQYPTSLWARDATVKIYYLDRYNEIYQRICDNLSKQIAELNTERSHNEANAGKVRADEKWGESKNERR